MRLGVASKGPQGGEENLQDGAGFGYGEETHNYLGDYIVSSLIHTFYKGGQNINPHFLDGEDI